MTVVSKDHTVPSSDAVEPSVPLRQFTLKQGELELTLCLPQDLYFLAEEVKSEVSLEVGKVETEMELFAEMLAVTMGKVQKTSLESTKHPFLGLLESFWKEFLRRYVQQHDVHVGVQMWAKHTTRVLQVYYQVLAILQTSIRRLPALFQENTHVFAVFGGQGNTLDYWSELQLAWNVYAPLLSTFIHAADSHLANLLHAQTKDLFTHGLSVLAWLQQSSPLPPQEYFLSAPVSLPLIALTQLAWYYATVAATGLSFQESKNWFHATTGHSQGILSAVVVASSTTYADFIENTMKALTLAYHVGTQATRAFPPTSLSPTILQDAQQHGEGSPSPMLLVTLPLDRVQYHVQETNRHLPAEKKIYVSLINGPKSVVVSGPPTSLYGLTLRLRKLKSTSDTAKPPSDRHLTFSARFLPITTPFHSPYLESAVGAIAALLQADTENVVFKKSALHLPVFCTHTGMDLRECSHDDLAMYLVKSICVDSVDWPKATKHVSTTHYVDFGPGGASGVGSLIHRNREGSGIQVILGTVFQSTWLLDRICLLDTRKSSVRYGPNWAHYRPRLVKIGNEVHLDTKYTRLVGRPPLMVAGMTPTSVNEDFVSAVLQAGYHVELAGGGHYTEQMLRDKVHTIMQRTKPGDTLSVNMMFLNPRQWAFQFPLVQQLRQEGYPIAGVCVAAGVPSPDVAHDILEKLTAAGIQHISFKPGSTDAIRQVIDIAVAHPTVPLLLQWTGGRAGGHHSYEDMHAPILETYAAIRKCDNLVLVAGSGFGGVADTLPYLTGDWSLKYDCPPMPFDAVLFGSRMLVAKEARTSNAVKDLIVACPGVENELEWEKTYEKPTGGILTVRSELGEPIHKVATRNVLLWKELDTTLFHLPKDKRLVMIKEKKQYFIERLNKDAPKVWFGKKTDGTVVDLGEMTYLEVIQRFIEICFIKKLQRWIDLSYVSLLMEFLVRVEERFTDTHLQVKSCVHVDALKTDPRQFMVSFLEKFPFIETQLLTTEDVFFFISVCQNPRYKPVPFIPILDEAFEVWYKKDSLWQSEFLEAVPDEDPQRVCILQGPVATRHATEANVPVKTILDTVYQGQIKAIQALYYSEPASTIPQREYLTEFTQRPSVSHPLVNCLDGKQFMLCHKVPTHQEWLNTLTAQAPQWFRAILLAPHFVQGRMFCNNYLNKLFAPRPHLSVTFHEGAVSTCALQLEGYPAPNLTMTYHESSAQKKIAVTLTHFYEGEKKAELNLFFWYRPEMAFSMIHEVMEERNQRTKQFYASLWNTSTAVSQEINPKENGFEIQHVVDRQSITRFCTVIQNDAELFVDRKQPLLAAPMDYAIVAGWQSVIQPLFSPYVDGDLLKLVHLTNGFKLLSPDALFHAGDALLTKSRVSSIVNTATGKKIETVAVISKDSVDLVEITSSFFIRGVFQDYHQTFENIREEPIQLTIANQQALAILKSKQYIQLLEEDEVQVGSVLSFRLNTLVYYESNRRYASMQTTGTIEMHYADEVRPMGQIHFQCDHPIAIQVSPVVAMLRRLGGVIVEQPDLFDQGNKYTIQSARFFSPVLNHAYASVSGDYNPIHTAPLFADLAGLPDTITHGMWTSALTRKYVELYAAENQPQRVVAYHVEFVDMCLPNTELETTLQHVGMQNGRKIIEVTTSTVQDQRVILKGTAQVEQARTCYVFTGQGSQEVGMGMDLYAQSPVARVIWDRADHHFKTSYGFSILEIVRTNCKSITVHFGGKQGREIRAHYRSMTIDVVDPENGKITTKSLFPTVNDETDSYTFSAPEGLLFATQFAQPALTLVEKAAFADMQSRGLVPSSCPFAGHSLGEYAALAAVADLLPVESLVDIVFYRGMTMQNAVPRDENGKSNYGMCAVNPARVHPAFKEKELKELVSYLAKESGSLLEIVNFNVENWQYVVAGDIQGLVALTEVLNHMSKGIFDKDELEAILRSKDLTKIPLERGHASIPLVGIDVPFHSSSLLPGVAPFRKHIQQKIKQCHVRLQKLENNYIPNLVAKPFQVTLDYVNYVYERTQSPILKDLREEFPVTSTDAKQKVAMSLLIELLAYQFASSVQWIQTQAVLFEEYKVERFIEVGPSATLTNMAERTLKLKYTAYDDARTFRRKNLSYARNKQEIYYEYNDEPSSLKSLPAKSNEVKVENAVSSPGTQTPSSVPAPTTQVASATAGNAAENIPDASIPSWLLLACVISQKLKVPVANLNLSKSIKDLVGGKSTMQNEILGDLQKEIESTPERAEEISIQELSEQVQVNGLGKHTSALVTKMISSKMPGGGFNLIQIKEYLASRFGLGPLRADALLLFGCTMEPTKRFATQEEAKTWLQQVAQGYASIAKIEYRQKQGGGNATDSDGKVSLSASQLKVLFASQRQLWAKHMQALASALNVDLTAPGQQLRQQQLLLDRIQQELDLWLSEHGDKYAQGIRPFFNPLKARRFDSAWNWVRQDAINLFFEIIFGRLKDVDRALIAQCLHVMNRADPHVIKFMEYWLQSHRPFFVKVQPENYALVHRLGMELVGNCREVSNVHPVYKYVDYPTAPETVINKNGRLEYNEALRPGVRKIAAYVEMMQRDQYLCIKEMNDTTQTWEYSKDMTDRYFKVLTQVAEEGLTLAGKTILMTGCGRDSIGSAILKGALSAGAKVVVTTSRFTQQITKYYRGIFERHGSRGSVLIVVPFNQGSGTDTQQLIQYIYKDLGWDLDFIVPFAAISENGREMTDIDSLSELAHRIMLTNLIRLLGYVISEKRARGIITRPAQVILPLSPNHGVFGGDGLYGESKIALECMLNRWSSESWAEYLCLVGAVIGWTRGTGLMQANNLVAQGVEEMGVYTFSQAEMAFNLLALMHPMLVRFAQEQTLYVDLAGRMNRLPKLNEKVALLRMQLIGNSEIQQAVLQDHQLDKNAIVDPKIERTVVPRANLRFDFPELPDYEELFNQLGHLQGMVDMERVVVVTGYGEVGPYGNSRTRWDMESKGQFSLEGCIEMAWMMGFIRHHQGMLDGVKYAGWVDTETGKPVRDTEIKNKYEERILKHTGIRLIEPELFDGYRPDHKTLLQEVLLEEDLSPVEMSKEEAKQFSKEHGDLCVMNELESGQCTIMLKKGARLYIPKALRFDRLVAGQIPTGWSAKRYGIPDDIIQQVDRITLYVLVSTMEAMVNSGITDPYELYKYVHVTEVGNASGSGKGGVQSDRKVYRDRFIDKPVQQDILQESFINTSAAWINLLLLSSSGPIKTPVGACATAVQSVEIGVETILSGKAKVVLVGGYDDLTEEGSYEFANMQATSNSDKEMLMGREPKEMCRPATSTRAGFMESHGAGMQILMSAAVAIEMGVPIYGIVALTNTATDKEGRSVPAPGKGILTTARQIHQHYPSKLLDIQYRRQQIQRQLKHISKWMEDEVQDLINEASTLPDANEREIFVNERKAALERDAHRQTKAALSIWSNDFYLQDPTIAPLRGALSVWGLTIDDIGVASAHGTGTKANDLNESQVLNQQFNHLGRSQGNPVPCIFQKYLTGHPKGAAASWMFNGMLQTIQTGIVPGNRNADNIDAAMQQFTHLLYPSVSTTTDGIKAGVLKSFGFGQVGGEALVLHPHFVLAVLKKNEYDAYVEKRAARQDKTYRYWHNTLTGSVDFVSVKTSPPYTTDQEQHIYLDPTARATWDASKLSYSFSGTKKQPALPLPEAWKSACTASPNNDGTSQKGIGIDIELISVFENPSSSLIERNFTAHEIEYCRSRPDPASSFAGKWAAKESVIKAISNFDLQHAKVWTQGSAAPLIDIEIQMANSGAPQVIFYGLAAKACEDVGVKDMKVSISHSGEYAMALSQAF